MRLQAAPGLLLGPVSHRPRRALQGRLGQGHLQCKYTRDDAKRLAYLPWSTLHEPQQSAWQPCARHQAAHGCASI